MVQAFEVTREVDHPVEQVWRQLTDWDRAAGWLGVDSIRAEGPTRAGTTLTFVTRGKERTSEIAEVDPGRSLTLRSQQGGVTADVRTRGAWALAGPMIRAAIRKTDSGQLDALDRELTAR